MAEGYFDPLDHSYIPGELSIEYVRDREKISFDQQIDFSSQEAIDALPQVWKDADIKVLKNTEDELTLDITVGYDKEKAPCEPSIIPQNIPSNVTESSITKC